MRVNINLSPEMASRVVEMSRQQQIPQATIMRRAVAAYLQINDQPLHQGRKPVAGGVEIPAGVVAG